MEPASERDGSGAVNPAFAAAFDSMGSVALEESAGVINVAPIVAVDPAGGFLVADAKEGQARSYDPRGRLLRTFGHSGRGPGEFQSPVAVLRMASGAVLVADAAEGRLTIFDGDGAAVLGTSQTPLFPVYGAAQLSDSTVLLAAHAPSAPASPLLHVWNLRSGRAERSFFPTPGGSVVRELAPTLGWAAFALAGDTVAAVFGLVDTLYVFGTGGSPRSRVRIPFAGFPVVTTPPAAARTDRRRQIRWMEKIIRVSDVFRLPDGSWLLQYARVRGAENEWGLLRMSADGRRLFEMDRTPRLVAVRGDSLFFVDPRSEVPSRWRIARFRAGS
ncbi:MAG TPA: hypothetical protein VF746_02970 [Longimicrobium sp.]|jgi:hypothetical protein